MASQQITPTMRRELQCIAKHGTFCELDDYGFSPLAFYARERVLTGLLNRGMIVPTVDGFDVTDAGRKALQWVTQSVKG
jgi:hypothetical protein